jgi:hypothetical protein
MVDTAPTFPEMLLQLEKWLDGHGLRDDDYLIDALWVTDGVSEQATPLFGFHTRADARFVALGSTVSYSRFEYCTRPWSLRHADMVDCLSSVAQRFCELFEFLPLLSLLGLGETALSHSADP